MGEGQGHLPAPPGGGAKGGYSWRARLLVPILVRAETPRPPPGSSRHRCCRRRRPPRGCRYFLLLSASASPLPQLPPRSWSGLPAFILAIGQWPRRSALSPTQPRTGLALRTPLGTGPSSSSRRDWTKGLDPVEKPLFIGCSGVHLPHLRSSIAIGPRRCRLAGSLPRSPLWDARGAEPRSVAVPSLLVARSRTLCLMYANLGTRAVRRAPEGISSAPWNLRVLSVRVVSSG